MSLSFVILVLIGAGLFGLLAAAVIAVIIAAWDRNR